MKMLDDILMAHTGVESGERGGSPRELDLNLVPPAAMWRNDAWRSPVRRICGTCNALMRRGGTWGEGCWKEPTDGISGASGLLRASGRVHWPRHQPPDVQERTDMKNQLCEDARRWAI